MVSHSFNGFPTATSGEFRQLLLAIGVSGAGAAKPTALDTFLGAHPIAKAFLTTQKPPPASYATLSYFGVNTFAYTDGRGRKSFVRYRFVPQAGEAFAAPADQLSGMEPKHLQAVAPSAWRRDLSSSTGTLRSREPTTSPPTRRCAWPESRRG